MLADAPLKVSGKSARKHLRLNGQNSTAPATQRKRRRRKNRNKNRGKKHKGIIKVNFNLACFNLHIKLFIVITSI